MLDLDPKGFRHLKDKNLLCLQTICEKSFREGIKLPFFFFEHLLPPRSSYYLTSFCFIREN